MAGDLHVHTTSSDGRMCGPRRVEQAASVGLACFAITDHNAISAIPSARLAAERWGVEVIAGAELDCDFRNLCTHIIGLFLDLDRPRFLREMLAAQDAWREWMRETMVEISRAAGVALEWGDLYFWGDVPTRGDLHDALRNKGYEGPIVEGGGVPYGPPGARYVPLPLTAEYVCDMIHRAGGAAILGHPWRNFAPGTLHDPAEFRDIVAMGIDGWECWRGDYTPEQTDYLLTWARRLNLLPSGGSDSHGPRPGRTLHPFGTVTVADEVVEALRDKAATYA